MLLFLLFYLLVLFCERHIWVSFYLLFRNLLFTIFFNLILQSWGINFFFVPIADPLNNWHLQLFPYELFNSFNFKFCRKNINVYSRFSIFSCSNLRLCSQMFVCYSTVTCKVLLNKTLVNIAQLDIDQVQL